MATAFDDLSSQIASALDDVFGESGGVTLSRGASTTAAVPATWLESQAERQTAMGGRVITQLTDRSWLIAAADYLIGAVAVTPAAGDRITDSSSVIWEVCQAGPLAAVETHGNRWLIRTKRISA